MNSNCPACQCECRCDTPAGGKLGGLVSNNAGALILGGLGLTALFIVKQVASSVIKEQWVLPWIEENRAEEEALGSGLV